MTARTLIAALAVTTLATTVPSVAAEKTGTSTADAASLQGEFVVENPTDQPIPYQMKWGSKGEWKSYTLEPGHRRRHWYPLDGKGEAPIPYVRWDNDGGDGSKVTTTTQEVNFGRVGYTGYNAKGNVNEAIHYQFKYRKDGRHIDLIER